MRAPASRKTGAIVNDAEYQAWLDGGMVGPPTTPGDHEHGHSEAAAKDEASYPKSFAEVVELIRTGKPIPGIMEIPDTILPAPTAAATAPARRKPWEKE
jgi:hypothetical protein